MVTCSSSLSLEYKQAVFEEKETQKAAYLTLL